MKKSYLIFAFLIYCLNATAQTSTNVSKGFAFAEKLKMLKPKDSISIALAQMQSIEKELTSADIIAKPAIDSTKWRLLYYHYAGWHESFPNHRTNFNELYVMQKQETLSLGAIFAECGIKNPIDPKLKSSNPLVIGRGKWNNVFLNEEYLIIRFVYSYPNGNQTSGYNERVYYFERVE